ncbi:hypothetical protein ACHAW6_014495 [Cyclotella cf. meneghiniana]
MSAEDPFWKQKELCWNVVLPDGWNETTPFKEKIHFLRLLECIIHAGSAKVGRVNIANIDYGMVAIYYRDQHHGMTVDCLLYAPFVKEWTVRGDREFVHSWKKERNQFPNHESEENRTKDIIGRIMSKQISWNGASFNSTRSLSLCQTCCPGVLQELACNLLGMLS